MNNSILRGFKNVFRNKTRSLVVVVVLAVSITAALVMLISFKTVQNKIKNVKQSIGNSITVSPAGIRGFEGGGEQLTNSDQTKIQKLFGVVKTVAVLNDHLSSSNTNLSPAQDAGSFGKRQLGQDSTDSQSTNQVNQPAPSDSSGHSFQMPVMVTATNDLSDISSLNLSGFTLKSGKVFNGSTSENVALVGTELATKNNLSVGSTFTAYNKTIKIIGIYDGGNRFSNGLVLMPLKALQVLSSQTNQINSINVSVSSVDEISKVSAEIKSKLGDKVDITTSEESVKQAIEPLENIRKISLFSMIGSAVASAIILFLIMIMIVRERRKEVGVLKAIGSSNAGIMTQFAAEATFLTLLSSVLGMILGLVLANPILKLMVSSNSVSEVGGPQGHGMMMRVGAGITSGVQNALQGIQANVGFEILAYGILAAIVIAVLGSVIPSFIISKIQPSEVLRND